MSPAPRKSIGSYEVERELGQGGMGIVYLARQPDLERRVVVKTLRRDLSEDRRCAERFRREAQAAAAVHHQNVVAVYDCFTWRGERFISQEYVDGVDLASVLESVGRLAPRIVGLVALEIARGLEEIHARGIVHRDLKPSNVLLGRSGEVKIADFGIAIDGKAPGLTQVGEAIGTPRYMSPEQLLGERVDTRSDLFSFGIGLYEMLAGEPPFQEEQESLLRRMERRRFRSLRRAAPGTPRWLARLVRRCLHPKTRRRLPTATRLRRELEWQLGAPPPADCRAEIAAWLWEREVFGSEESDATRPQAPAAERRRRGAALLPWAAAAAVGLALLAAATSSWVSVAAKLLEVAVAR